MAFDARTLALRGVLLTSPDAGESGIWQSDTGPAADGTGCIFVITGNCRFDADHGGSDLGNSVLALAADDESLRVADSFTPFDQAALDAEDGDLGSGGPMLAGGDTTGPARLVFASKAGTLYVLRSAAPRWLSRGARCGRRAELHAVRRRIRRAGLLERPRVHPGQ